MDKKLIVYRTRNGNGEDHFVVKEEGDSRTSISGVTIPDLVKLVQMKVSILHESHVQDVADIEFDSETRIEHIPFSSPIFCTPFTDEEKKEFWAAYFLLILQASP